MPGCGWRCDEIFLSDADADKTALPHEECCMLCWANSWNVWQMNIGRASRRWTQSDLPLRSTTGAIPEYFWMSVASAQRDRSEPNRDRRRGASCSPAPGRLSKRKWSGLDLKSSLILRSNSLIA